MELKDIMLSKISKTQKEKYHMISLYVESKTVKLLEAERRMVVAGMGGGGSGVMLVKSTAFQLCKVNRLVEQPEPP